MASANTLPTLSQGPPFVPQGLTKAQVQETYHKYQQMQDQGVRPDNPEFIKAVNILQAVQKQQNFVKQRALAQQQTQQQQAQQQQIAKAQETTNGANGHVPNSAGSDGQKSSISPPAADTAPNAVAKSGATASKPQVMASNSFSPEQMQTLRNQILAFKMLSKNLPIPTNISQQLFPSQQNKRQPSVPQAVAAAGQVLAEVQTAKKQSADRTSKDYNPAPHHQYKSFVAPRSKIQPSINYANHGPEVQTLWLPSLLPPGVDVDRIREERERIIYNRIQARKTELENLKVDIGSWDTSKSDTPNPDDSIKLKALIEYKMLSLLPKQRALRQQISRDMLHYDNLAQTTNRSMYRRVKKQSLREARITEKLEKQQRDARETKEKKKHIDHLQAIARHREEIEQNAKAQKARVQKLGRLMLQQHGQIEKEEQK
ncbi:MAG: hypothetical protein L6R41_007607, partial [Letrouitia leprolyta]